jgi:DNA repair protein RAD51
MEEHPIILMTRCIAIFIVRRTCWRCLATVRGQHQHRGMSRSSVVERARSKTTEIFHPIEELEQQGVLATDVKKLREAGIVTCLGVLQRPRRLLLDIKGLSEAKVDKIMAAARTAAGDVSYRSGTECLAVRQRVFHLRTGSDALDTLLGGGLESASITEVYGEYRCGKTQLCHTLAVTAQAADESHAGRVVYIDTEGNFRPERIRAIATRFSIDADDVLENIAHARAYTTDQQLELLREAAALMCESRFALVIVDSATALYRVDYSGRGELSARQQHLNQFMSTLGKLAEEFNVCALVTNQVQACPDGAAAMFSSNPLKPIGGHIMAHASTTRLALRKGRGEQRIAKLVDSPCLPEGEATFEINAGGIADAAD